MPEPESAAAAPRNNSERPGRPSTGTTRARSRRLTIEIWIVLGLSLGKSGVYAIVAIIAALTRGPLAGQTTALNTSQSTRAYLDLTYQILAIAFAVIPVALVLYLLTDRSAKPWRLIGLDTSRPLKDLGWGIALGAAIGIPGLGLYVAGRALGLTVAVQASALDPYWWTVPVLILSALHNGLLEEVIVIGYLFTRLAEKGWRPAAIVVSCAVIRGSYHLYQGWGPFFANALMGVIFGCFYLSKWGRRRVMPLVITHTIIDMTAFLGYQYLPTSWLHALGVAIAGG